MATHSIEVIDSHTGGEPTRVVIAGGPDLGTGPLAERRERFRREFDRFRSAIVNEPRGSDVVVGALLVPPEDASCAAGVIFFNNVGYLGMCGHGTIGLVATLAHLGRIGPGTHRIETPVGDVTATLDAGRAVCRSTNVASWRIAKAVTVESARPRRDHRRRGLGRQLVLPGRRNTARNSRWPTCGRGCTDFAGGCARRSTSRATRTSITSNSSALAPVAPTANSRNFVLCPGKAYDRSPCGTGTSAKLACLAADGKLAKAPGGSRRAFSAAPSAARSAGSIARRAQSVR